MYEEDSYFDGGLLQQIGWTLLGSLVSTITFGLGAPFACCLLYRWEANHTVINGHRLLFTGTAWELFKQWIKWLLLSIITIGIYSLWIPIKLKKWRIAHTKFVDEYSMPGLDDQSSEAALDEENNTEGITKDKSIESTIRTEQQKNSKKETAGSLVDEYKINQPGRVD